MRIVQWNLVMAEHYHPCSTEVKRELIAFALVLRFSCLRGINPALLDERDSLKIAIETIEEQFLKALVRKMKGDLRHENLKVFAPQAGCFLHFKAKLLYWVEVFLCGFPQKM